MEITQLSNKPLQIESSDDILTVKTVENCKVNGSQIILNKPQKKSSKRIEVRLFEEDEIRELQRIAREIYRQKEKEQSVKVYIGNDEVAEARPQNWFKRLAYKISDKTL